ncbi:hypothetical protein Tco_0481876 [Tanacetum coccineum]
MIAPGPSRNNPKESFCSNDKARNYFLEEASKMTQERNRNFKPREMPSARIHHTPNYCKPIPRSNTQTSRNWHASKSSDITLQVVQKTYHSRNPSSFSDSRQFVCSTCQKCVFNANHDACITKFLKEIFIGHSFSPNKSFDVYKKTSPRSCLRWKPTGRIFNTVGLRWVPTGKIFTSNTTKIDSKPPNGSNEDITNPYECKQTLNVNASTLNLSAGLVSNPSSFTLYSPPTKKDLDILFQPLFDEYFLPPSSVVSLVLLIAAPLPADTTVVHQGVEEQIQGIQSAEFDNAPLIHNLTPDPSSEESSSQGVIPSNLHQLNQSFDNLTKWSKDHPLDNVIGNPSRPVSTRSQLQTHDIWCYFDAHGYPIPFGEKRSG